MEKLIAALPLRLFYAERLIDAPSTALSKRPLARRFAAFLHQYYPTRGGGIKRYLNTTASATDVLGTSKYNLFTAAAGMEVLDRLVLGGADPSHVAIATPYQAQYEVYRSALRCLQTVHRSSNLDRVRIRKIGGYRGGESV